MSVALAQVRAGYEGPEVPEDVLKRLRQINPQLGLRFYQGTGWAVMWKWADTDRRREYIKLGQLPPDEDNDIVCYLPDEIGPEAAVGYVESRCVNHPVSHIAGLVADVAADRARVQEQAFQPVMDEALNQIEVNPSKLFEGAGKTITKKFAAGFGKGARTEVNRT